MTIAKPDITRVTALHQFRQLHGSTRPQLMRCSDQTLYAVKFPNNPQGRRVLANELLGTLLAKDLGLPVPEPAIVDVPYSLAYTGNELTSHSRGNGPRQHGPSFGSTCVTIDRCSSLPPRGYSIPNVGDFLGALVFDKWTCNMDARQALFVPQIGTRQCRVWMIDQGLCFNGKHWNFPHSQRKGLFHPFAVYKGVGGIDSFEPWLQKLERDISHEVLAAVARQIPTEWYGDAPEPLLQMIEILNARRREVPDLIIAEQKSLPEIFPDWRQKFSLNAA